MAKATTAKAAVEAEAVAVAVAVAIAAAAAAVVAIVAMASKWLATKTSWPKGDPSTGRAWRPGGRDQFPGLLSATAEVRPRSTTAGGFSPAAF